MPIIDELITLLGFDADDSEGKRFAGTLGTIKTAAAAVGAAVLAAEGAVLSWTNAVAASTDELGKFGASFGEDIERLQQWEFATERAGGKAGDLRADIANLTKTLASPIPGEFNQAMAMLGITIFDSTGKLKSGGDVLDEVIDKFAGLDAGQRQILAGQIGISESTLRFISQGRGEIERLSQLASDLGGVLPEEATIIAAEYADRMTDVNTIIGGIGKSLAISLLPGMINALEIFEFWALENKEFIKTNLKSVIEGIGMAFNFVFEAGGRLYDKVIELFPGFEGLSEKIDISQLAFTGIVTVIGILIGAFSSAILSAAQVGAAFAGIVLIIDDLVAFIQGKKSVIGTLFDSILERYPILQQTIDRIKSLFSDFIDGVVPLFIGLGITFKQVFDILTDDSNLFGQTIDFVINNAIGAVNLFLDVLNLISKIIATIAALLAGDMQTAVAGITDIFDDLGAIAEEGLRPITEWIGKIIDKIGLLSESWDEFKESFSLESLSQAGEDIGEFADQFVEGTKGFFGRQLESLAQAGADIGEFATQLFGGETPAAGPVSAIAPAVPINAVAGGKTLNNTQTTTNNFNIQGTANPQEVANKVATTLGRQQSELSRAALFGANPVLE